MKFIHKPTYNKCDSPRVQILIQILSSPDHYHHRAAIRATWAKVLFDNPIRYSHIRLLFVFGVDSPPLSQQYVQTEFKEHGDVLVGSFEDNPDAPRTKKTTTLKTLLGAKWSVDNLCIHENAVIVTAPDSVFVNITILAPVLEALIKTATPSSRFWIGDIREGVRPKRPDQTPPELINTYPQVLTKEEFPGELLPTYCILNIGFVFSYTAAKHLYSWSWDNKLFRSAEITLATAAKSGKWQVSRNSEIIPDLSLSNACMTKRLTMSVGYTSTDVLINHRTHVEVLRQCHDPPLNAVLPKFEVSNQKLFQTALDFKINPINTCQDSSGNLLRELFLIMLINSAPEDTARRQAIRGTWGKLKRLQDRNMRLIFVLAKSQNHNDNDMVQKESNTYRDLLVFDFFETHFNLTLKFVGGLKWVSQHCTNAKFIYRGDDDMFVNIDIVIAHLAAPRGTRQTFVTGAWYSPVYINRVFPKESLYLGSRSIGPVVRDMESKYYISWEDYVGRYFPPYSLGGGYILSFDVVPALYDASLTVSLLNCDDVYQGILAKKIGLQQVHVHGIKNLPEKEHSVCFMRQNVWTFRGLHSEKLKEFWKRFIYPQQKCEL